MGGARIGGGSGTERWGYGHQWSEALAWSSISPCWVFRWRTRRNCSGVGESSSELLTSAGWCADFHLQETGAVPEGELKPSSEEITVHWAQRWPSTEVIFWETSGVWWRHGQDTEAPAANEREAAAQISAGDDADSIEPFSGEGEHRLGIDLKGDDPPFVDVQQVLQHGVLWLWREHGGGSDSVNRHQCVGDLAGERSCRSSNTSIWHAVGFWNWRRSWRSRALCATSRRSLVEPNAWIFDNTFNASHSADKNAASPDNGSYAAWGASSHAETTVKREEFEPIIRNQKQEPPPSRDYWILSVEEGELCRVHMFDILAFYWCDNEEAAHREFPKLISKDWLTGVRATQVYYLHNPIHWGGVKLVWWWRQHVGPLLPAAAESHDEWLHCGQPDLGWTRNEASMEHSTELGWILARVDQIPDQGPDKIQDSFRRLDEGKASCWADVERRSESCSGFRGNSRGYRLAQLWHDGSAFWTPGHAGGAGGDSHAAADINVVQQELQEVFFNFVRFSDLPCPNQQSQHAGIKELVDDPEDLRDAQQPETGKVRLELKWSDLSPAWQRAFEQPILDALASSMTRWLTSWKMKWWIERRFFLLGFWWTRVTRGTFTQMTMPWKALPWRPDWPLQVIETCELENMRRRVLQLACWLRISSAFVRHSGTARYSSQTFKLPFCRETICLRRKGSLSRPPRTTHCLSGSSCRTRSLLKPEPTFFAWRRQDLDWQNHHVYGYGIIVSREMLSPLGAGRWNYVLAFSHFLDLMRNYELFWRYTWMTYAWLHIQIISRRCMTTSMPCSALENGNILVTGQSFVDAMRSSLRTAPCWCKWIPMPSGWWIRLWDSRHNSASVTTQWKEVDWNNHGPIELDDTSVPGRPVFWSVKDSTAGGSQWPISAHWTQDPGGSGMSEMIVLAVSDASFAGMPRGRSQGGLVVAFANLKILEGQSKLCIVTRHSGL